MRVALSILGLCLLAFVAPSEVQIVPVYQQQGHLGFAAYWTYPTNGVWIAECSTNLVDWAQCGNETVLPGRRGYTETAGGRVFVRLRRIL